MERDRDQLLTATIEDVLFRSPDGQYCVLRAHAPSAGPEPVVLVGELRNTAPGETLRVRGRYEQHPSFGRRFRVESFSPVLPTTANGIARYLGSGLIEGIGAGLATRMVERFGDKTLEVITTQSARLREVPGIGAQRAEAIASAVRGRIGEAEVTSFLQSLGLGPALSARIRKRYGEDTARVVREDPYLAAEQVAGIGFRTADAMARALGFSEDDPRRAAGAALHLVARAADGGHTFLPIQELAQQAQALHIPRERLHEAVADLHGRGLLCVEGTSVYAPPLYTAEVAVANRLRELATQRTPASAAPSNTAPASPAAKLAAASAVNSARNTPAAASRGTQRAPASTPQGTGADGSSPATRQLSAPRSDDSERSELAAFGGGQRAPAEDSSIPRRPDAEGSSPATRQFSAPRSDDSERSERAAFGGGQRAPAEDSSIPRRPDAEGSSPATGQFSAPRSDDSERSERAAFGGGQRAPAEDSSIPRRPDAEDGALAPGQHAPASAASAAHAGALAAGGGGTSSDGVVWEQLAAAQQEAVGATFECRLLVVTGGPGTGKTTTVRAIVQAQERAQRRVRLCAPTGRAAKRLSEASGREAQTIHRLLEWNPGSGTFARNRSAPLETDLVLVDEASMLDIQLARHLLDALPRSATLILVGDADQLPPVGAGPVLRELIASNVCRVVRLTEVFRQAESSTIVRAAHQILHGQRPTPSVAGTRGPGDLFIVRAEQPEQVAQRLKEALGRVQAAYGLDPIQDVQVLSPMRRGPLGTEALNKLLQATLNPAPAMASASSGGFRPGDKVMQLKNDYEREVWNGDLGTVQRIDAGVVFVDMQGRSVSYEPEAQSALTLAYACTVHKVQGSEFPAAIVVLHRSHHLLLTRPLIYTALTRARRLALVIGDDAGLMRAVRNAEQQVTHTRLATRLQMPAS